MSPTLTYANVPDGMEAPAGDMAQLDSSLESLHERALQVRGKLIRLYENGEAKAANLRPIVSGRIPQLQGRLEDISDALNEIEKIVDRL